MGDRREGMDLTNARNVGKTVDAAGWAAFFVWIGTVQLAHVNGGAGLLGVGLIILGAQAARRSLGRPWEGFWVCTGFLFVLGGIWQSLHIQLNLFPLLCIAAGVACLVFAVIRRSVHAGADVHSGAW